jgi:hypothetical protein
VIRANAQGVQLLLPGQDAGIDFAREYGLAKGMVGVEPKGWTGVLGLHG